MKRLFLILIAALGACTEGGAIEQPSCLLLCLIGGGGVVIPTGGMP